MKESHNSTPSKRVNEGADTNHAKAGYADTIISNVNKISSGFRPIRSDAAPITGSQNRLDMPTRSLASLLKFFGFLERIAQYEKKRNDQAANQEWNAPTPHHHILRWNQRAQKHAEERDEDDSNLLATRLPTDIQ